METHHTKDTWNFCKLARTIRVYSISTQTEVCTIQLSTYQPEANARKLADAKRIVECVNVCKGIPTNELDYFRSEGALKILANKLELQARYDELAEVLTEAQEELRLIRMKDSPAVYDPTLRARIQIALSKAKP